MNPEWKVEFYRDAQNKIPVNEFMESLELKTQAKVRNAIRLLQMFGISVSTPLIKKLTGTDLWELRIVGSDSIRILYVTLSGRTFLLLHGFKKKKQKTPPREINTAKMRLVDYKSRMKKLG